MRTTEVESIDPEYDKIVDQIVPVVRKAIEDARENEIGPRDMLPKAIAEVEALLIDKSETTLRRLLAHFFCTVIVNRHQEHGKPGVHKHIVEIRVRE